MDGNGTPGAEGTAHGAMDGAPAALAVLERLARIERLDRERAAPGVLLEELRALLREAEAWTRQEGGEAGEEAVAQLRSALARDMIAV